MKGRAYGLISSSRRACVRACVCVCVPVTCMCPAGTRGVQARIYVELFLHLQHAFTCLTATYNIHTCVCGWSDCTHGRLFILLLSLCPSLGGGPGLLRIVTFTRVSPISAPANCSCEHLPASLHNLSSAQLLGKGFSPPLWKTATN